MFCLLLIVLVMGIMIHVPTPIHVPTKHPCPLPSPQAPLQKAGPYRPSPLVSSSCYPCVLSPACLPSSIGLWTLQFVVCRVPDGCPVGPPRMSQDCFVRLLSLVLFLSLFLLFRTRGTLGLGNPAMWVPNGVGMAMKTDYQESLFQPGHITHL